jgi:hypothetical protein
MQKGTVEIFNSYPGFVRKIKATFGEVDEVRQAERAIQMLRQRGSAATYTAEFQRQAIKAGWDDKALKAQYYRGLKDAVKDELIKQDRPDNMEELIEQAVNIDNRLYERALERKGFYDTTHKRRDHRPTRYTEPMELDATNRQELSPQDRQKRMHDKLCFNCGKPGHMARNCRSGGRSRKPAPRRGELNVATRGRGSYDTTGTPFNYNGQMQLNATNFIGFCPEAPKHRRGEDSDFEDINQSLATVGFVENLGSDDEDNKSETSELSSSPSEITEHEYRTAHILAGTEKAQTYFEASRKMHHEALEKLDLKYGNYFDDCRIHINYLKDKLDAMGSYRYELMTLDNAIDRQVQEMHRSNEIGVSRSQQYRDKLTDNLDFQQRILRKERSGQTKLRSIVEDELENLRRRENVASTDHPRHGELSWSFCYTDSCSIHQSSKSGSGYWPHRKTPVYWGKPTISTTALKTAEQSKN